MNVWLVSREYAGIAEAGGVKNVSCSLSENLAALGHSVTLFIPMYGCTDISQLKAFQNEWKIPVTVTASGSNCQVSYSHGTFNGVEIVFVNHRCFSEKKAVYTYTREEEKEDSSHKQGTGHSDVLFMNTLFQKAVIAYGTLLEEDSSQGPQIIHCQDAATSMVPVFMEHEKKISESAKNFFMNTKCVVTIHNAGPGYHHEFYSMHDAQFITGLPAELLQSGLNGQNIEPFLLAETCSCITTVSPQYAEEIISGKTDTAGLSEEFRRRGTKIIGITNGIDLSRYTPSDTSQSLLPYPFDPESENFEGKYKCRSHLLTKYASENKRNANPKDIETYGYIVPNDGHDITYVAYHGRVVWQKGITVLAKSAEQLLEKNLPVRFIFIGQGQPELEKELTQLALRYEGKCVYFRGYDRFLSRLCMASADVAVFPSFFEPCGLEDLIAQIFGTIPVAHATGGLCKITDDETGFLYRENTPEKLTSILEALIKIKSRAGTDFFRRMISHTSANVRDNFSWKKVIQNKYIPLYESL